MGRLIKIHDIDEFSEIMSIPDTAINSIIISNVRKLDEENELERFVREIISDPNNTPHGPTEIADILTSHVHVRGEKQLVAFVLKGKSFQKVSSKDVTHQFAKLRQIPNLNLMVFGAVGHIQDDAQRDFVQTAIDANCNYLIIDAHDWARLFIAYGKICPKDGLPYDCNGFCSNGHLHDKSIKLEMEVREQAKYTILQQSDLSHSGAKRYSAIVLLDKHYPKDVIREIIYKVTQKMRLSNYYRNERIKARWGKNPAHVVWLYLAFDVEDVQNANWFCRTCWIDSSLPKQMQPISLKGNEKYRDIDILWNNEYKIYKNIFEKYQGTKEEILETNKTILNEMLVLTNQAIEYYKRYCSGTLPEEEFIEMMQEIEPRITELYFQSGNIPMPPEDCKDYDQACQNVFATIHDIFLYYSKKGLETWDRKNRKILMDITLQRFYDDLERVKFEEKKIH